MTNRLALLADARVPGDARVLALYLLELGEGWHEVPHDDFRALVGGGVSDDTIGRLVRALEGSGWVERKPGGRGHSPSYRVIPPQECGPNGPVRSALGMWITEKVRSDAAGKNNHPANADLSISIDPQHGALKPLGAPHGGSKSSDVVVEEEVVGTPPVVPPVSAGQVSERAAELIAEHGETLAGCRGALRDYLAARVPIRSQAGYVGSVLTWLQGGFDQRMWMLEDGGKLPPEKRTAVLAQALNELATADEEKQRKWAPGDVQNLRNKVEAIVRPKAPRRSDGEGRGGSSRGGDRGRGPGINELWGRRAGSDPIGGAPA